MICNLLKFICFLAQSLQLQCNLLALLMNAPQQRRQFFVGIIFQRMVQIQRIQRTNNFLGHPMRQQHRKNNCKNSHKQNRTQHEQHQRQYCRLTNRDTKHRSIRQFFRTIQSFLCQRTGISHTAAFTLDKGLLHLHAISMILHIS